MLIMSRSHRQAFRVRLGLEGLNVQRCEDSGQLTCVTSEELLSKFVVGGAIDETVFRSTIADLIHQANRGRDGLPRRVRVFGEMVSQLRGTNLAATTRLEELWDEVIKEHSVALLCTYVLEHERDHLPDTLVAMHTHNIEREAAG